MKTLKKLKIALILLFVAVIIFASFFGIYKKEDFRAVNIIKDYKLGMQWTNKVKFTGTVKQEEKEVIYDQDGNVVEDDGETEYTEENGYTKKTEKIVDENVSNIDNYKKAKKIIKNRLKGMGVGEYKLELNKETGEIGITLQDTDETHEIEEQLTRMGKFTIVDKDTEEVLLDNSQVKSAKVLYGPSQADVNATVVYLQLDFDKEGTKKLEEISQIYVENKTTEENEEGESEEVDNTKYVSVKVDDETISSTYFGEKMSTGTLYVPITQASDSEELANKIKSVNNIVTVIKSGELPIEYEFEEETIESDFNKDKLVILIASFAVIYMLELVFITLKFRVKGFVAGFMQIGYLALVLLAIRYTNVITTVQAIVGIGISAVLNMVFNYLILNELKSKNEISWNLIGKFALWTLPLYVIAIVLSFNSLTVVNSLGMTLVWGSICLYLYNLSLTKRALELLTK